jgi:hypothetical protein
VCLPSSTIAPYQFRDEGAPLRKHRLDHEAGIDRLTFKSGLRAVAREEMHMHQIYLIIEWPSKDVAKAFYECDEYRPYRQSRIEGATNEFLLVCPGLQRVICASSTSIIRRSKPHPVRRLDFSSPLVTATMRDVHPDALTL